MISDDHRHVCSGGQGRLQVTLHSTPNPPYIRVVKLGLPLPLSSGCPIALGEGEISVYNPLYQSASRRAIHWVCCAVPVTQNAQTIVDGSFGVSGVPVVCSSRGVKGCIPYSTKYELANYFLPTSANAWPCHWLPTVTRIVAATCTRMGGLRE